jgi:phosphatidylinositol alpha-mannosyltransferase
MLTYKVLSIYLYCLKILLCSDSYYPHPGGVSEYMHFLALYLRKLGQHVTILAPSYEQPYDDDEHTARIGKCYLVTGNMATITITFHRKLPILVRNFIAFHNFDIVHTNGPLGWTLPYWAFHYSRGINVATFHTAFTGMNLYTIAKVIFKREFQKRLHGAIYPSATAFRTTYPHLPSDFRIIPNGIDVSRFSRSVKPIERFPKDRPKILFLGRLDPRKGLDKLLKAYPFIKKQLPRAILIVVGSGSSSAHYKSMIPKCYRDSVFFEGRVSADMVPRYYATADVYVSPATGGEVFGIVLTEAMATGTPVVASDIPGYNEVVKDGTNGLLCNPHDAEDIAQKVVQILTNVDLKNKLLRGAHDYAQRVSWYNCARQVLRYYYDLQKKQKEVV